jgi:AcrR family transcriptional regulator
MKKVMKTLSSTKVIKSTSTPKTERKSVLNQVKKDLILNAARGAFLELGLDGASLREIAKRSGYTPGAIYSYFSSREEIYASLLGESLSRLKESVVHADFSKNVFLTKKNKSPEKVLTLYARAQAFFMFYYDHPQDLDLGFYLFNGTQPKGLTPELNQILNQQLQDSIAPIENSLKEIGFTKVQASKETTGIFAQAVGLLILHNTGRIRLFKQDPKELFQNHLNQVVAKL